MCNVSELKGIHYAMHAGIYAADAIVEALKRDSINFEAYDEKVRGSVIGKDMYRSRNMRQPFSRGFFLGGALASAMTVTKGAFPGGHFKQEHDAENEMVLDGAAKNYPKPDGKISFDKLSSVFLSNTNHEEDQPVHLKVTDMNLQKTSEHDVFAGPSNRYCPAGVYEWVEEASGPRFQINAQNCVHCKTCDVKDPNGNITWVPPEGGGGPNYEAM
jgi:electron-transferring-flavoprotein dehydrogenase